MRVCRIFFGEDERDFGTYVSEEDAGRIIRGAGWVAVRFLHVGMCDIPGHASRGGQTWPPQALTCLGGGAIGRVQCSAVVRIMDAIDLPLKPPPPKAA